MIRIKHEDVELTLPEETLDEGTELFLKVMMSLIKKASNNPAIQLNVLSLIHSGKTFNELVTKQDVTESMLMFIKQVVKETTKMDIRVEPNLSGDTLDDFLNRKDI